MRRWTTVHLDEHISSTMGATLLRGADWYVVYSSKERCHPIQWSLWAGTAEALGVWRSRQEDEAEDLADTPNSGMAASLSPGQMVMPHRPVFIKSPTEENSWLPHPAHDFSSSQFLSLLWPALNVYPSISWIFLSLSSHCGPCSMFWSSTLPLQPVSTAAAAALSPADWLLPSSCIDPLTAEIYVVTYKVWSENEF